MRDDLSKGKPSHGRNAFDPREGRSIRLWSPEHFLQRPDETEAIRFLPGGIPSGGFPITVDWEIYIPSSRIDLVFGWMFDQDAGQPSQPDNYVYNATWGPAHAEGLLANGAYRHMNQLFPALTPLPNSWEVNSGVKRARGKAVFTAAPTVLGVPVPGAWKFWTIAEPNQSFTGTTEEWDRIANEIQVRVGNWRPTGEGGAGAIGPARGQGPALLISACAPLALVGNPVVQGLAGPVVPTAFAVAPVGPACQVPPPPITLRADFVQDIANGHFSSDGVTADDLVQFGPKPNPPDCEACDPEGAPLASTAVIVPVTTPTGPPRVVGTFFDVIPAGSIAKFWVYAEPADTPGAACGQFFGPFCFGTEDPIA